MNFFSHCQNYYCDDQHIKCCDLIKCSDSSHIYQSLFFPYARGKRGFGSKRLVLFSNFCGEFGDDQVDDIIASMLEVEIDLDIM